LLAVAYLNQFHNVEQESFDMIFIDAAKAQSKKFFELYTPLLKEGGVVITDNVLYHGFVSDISVVRTRNGLIHHQYLKS
jgi:predicted O-methyltransferase YrrM